MDDLSCPITNFLVDSEKQNLEPEKMTKEKLLELKSICEGASKLPWNVEENELYQQIFSNPIVSFKDETGKVFEILGHGLQLAKIPKTSSSYAEYWFAKRDLDFIMSASKYMLPLIKELLKNYE